MRASRLTKQGIWAVLALAATLLLGSCAHVETFSLSLDPMGAKPPPRGYVAFCQQHKDTCQGGVEQTVVYTLRKRWLRKRRVVYHEYFWSHADALEAVGLSEQDPLADSP